ncbi:MAG: pyridine nucleotide transhydrogenase [Cyanobacteriota bacterium]|jgi:nucleoside-diphosphate-sugar epimerase|nr:pyridine nucleotide transhydrogenase [Cyanobacteriota bacterium]
MTPQAPRHALIGHSGFVGSTLKRQHRFSAFYRSTDIATVAGEHFELVVCAGAPAKKWLANQQPEADRRSLAALMQALAGLRADRFVLISTVDVFADPSGVDERAPLPTAGLHPYGLHRLELERFVQRTFPGALVVRLPGLVGPGLRKNIIYDILNNNDLHKIDSRSIFQFYPMVNLWADLRRALDLALPLLHLTAEPISVGEVSADGFGLPFASEVMSHPPRYDFQSLHAGAMGGQGRYQYSRREVIQAIRAYAQSEPPAAAAEPGR